MSIQYWHSSSMLRKNYWSCDWLLECPFLNVTQKFSRARCGHVFFFIQIALLTSLWNKHRGLFDKILLFRSKKGIASGAETSTVSKLCTIETRIRLHWRKHSLVPVSITIKLVNRRMSHNRMLVGNLSYRQLTDIKFLKCSTQIERFEGRPQKLSLVNLKVSVEEQIDTNHYEGQNLMFDLPFFKKLTDKIQLNKPKPKYEKPRLNVRDAAKRTHLAHSRERVYSMAPFNATLLCAVFLFDAEIGALFWIVKIGVYR